MNNETTQPLTQSDLDQFSGTEHYYRNFTGLIYTDGVKFLADRGNAYWLIDAIGSHQINPKLRKGRLGDLQFWKLEVKDNKAVLTCRADTDVPPAVTQKFEYTDFPLASVEIWVGRDERGRVAYLPSEH